MFSLNKRPASLMQPLAMLAAACCLFLAGRYCLAEPAIQASAGPAISQEQILTQFPADLKAAWPKVVDSVRNNDFVAAEAAISQVNQVKFRAGIEALEDYSLYLIAQSYELIGSGDREGAIFLLTNANHFPPISARVAIASTGAVVRTGGNLSQHLCRTARLTIRDPALVLGLLANSIYPLLWVATFSLLFVMALNFLVQMRRMHKNVIGRYPAGVRGWATPLTILVLLCWPLPFGPIWTLGAWSLATIFLIGRNRILAVIASLVLAGWAGLVPLRENVWLWLQSAVRKLC